MKLVSNRHLSYISCMKYRYVGTKYMYFMTTNSMYFSRTRNVNAPTMLYHVVRDIVLSELSIFQWKGTGVGATSAHYITDKEWNYSMLYLYTNMVEAEPYFEKFDEIY
jgi:hypothetical protein